MSHLQRLRRQGFSELACQFGDWLGRVAITQGAEVAECGALLIDWVADGHTCLSLTELDAHLPWRLAYDPDSYWQALCASGVLGTEQEYRPLIGFSGRVYLHRHFVAEQRVASAIRLRCQPVAVDLARCQTAFAQWPSAAKSPDWQRIAIAVALTQQLTVITGGPGTGKSTIVHKICEILTACEPEIRIALAAPTGKAAGRLQASLPPSLAATLSVKTVHRLLGIHPRKPQGVYDKHQPLPIDLLIVDEVSMLDVELMASLLGALPSSARLILLGDPHQLASVEAGAVLSNLCAFAPTYAPETAQTIQALSGQEVPVSMLAEQPQVLRNHRVALQESYRFRADSLLGQLAAAVLEGSWPSRAEQPMPDGTAVQSSSGLIALDAWADQVLAGYSAFIEAVEQQRALADVFECFEAFRVLVATRQGPYSMQAVHQRLLSHLKARGWASEQPVFVGMPILITQNDHQLELYNGDLGLVWQQEQQMVAVFRAIDGWRSLPIARLPNFEQAFAMTIHKSQGSEFDQVLVLLGAQVSSMHSRELLYTAITRARERVQVCASPEVLTYCLAQPMRRDSGLSECLLRNL